MAVNKVELNTADGKEILIDLTGDTVSPETLAEGVTAHNASGEVITGTMPMSRGEYDITSTTNADGTQNLAIVDAGSGSTEPLLKQLDVWENGQYTPSPPYVGFNVVNVGVTPTIETVSITVIDEHPSTMMGMNVVYVNSQGAFGYATLAPGCRMSLTVMKDTFVAFESFESTGTIESSNPYTWLFSDKSVWCVSDGQTYTRKA